MCTEIFIDNVILTAPAFADDLTTRTGAKETMQNFLTVSLTFQLCGGWNLIHPSVLLLPMVSMTKIAKVSP